MKTLRDSVYILVAVGSLALAVCQPSEAGAEQAGQAGQAGQAFASAVTEMGNALQASTEPAPR